MARSSCLWVGSPLLAAILLLILGVFLTIPWVLMISMTLFVLSIFMAFFHRDPERVPQGDGMISPADGLVVEASGDMVAIFMNHHNVHVNRSPLGGRVTAVEHGDGGHRPAFFRSSSKNERNLIVIDTPEGAVRLTQITGILVRRIVCYVRPGDFVERGQRIGMIRFGSRVEFSIPPGYSLRAGLGDKVRAGETVVAVKAR